MKLIIIFSITAIVAGVITHQYVEIKHLQKRLKLEEKHRKEITEAYEEALDKTRKAARGVFK